MQAKEIQELAQKIQLEIKPDEMPDCLEIFQHLEELLVNFKKTKIKKDLKIMTQINIGYLTLSNLEKLKKKFTNRLVSQETLRANSEITEDGFILLRYV